MVCGHSALHPDTPSGGDTNFATVKALSALHEGQPHHKMDGKLPTALHPVARTHPETGRHNPFRESRIHPALYGNDDLDEAETADLLDELLINVGRAEFTCRFRWAPGSVAMWDNRAVQHCATADFWPHRRVMERVTILDYDLSRRKPFFGT